MIATIVIWKAPSPHQDATFQQVTMVKVKPPTPQPTSSGDRAQNPQFEPDQVTVPVVTPPSVLTTANSSSFAVDSSKLVKEALSHLNEASPQGGGMTSGAGNTGAGSGAGFGSFTGGTNDFEGTVYDLKIGTDHHGTGMNQATYTRILTDFVKQGWDEKVFAPYYKASKKLYAPAIWIPTTPSDDCAKEMGLNNELSSKMWVGWYKAKVKPPQSGKYHFIGFGDDILAVAVNGQLVLDGSLWPVTKAPQHMPWPYTDWSHLCTWREQNYGKLRVGDSFEANSLESVTIDVLMGDEPGGFYNAYLLIADDSKTYPAGPAGVPLYPIFQLGSDPINRPGDQPPHATTTEPWTGAP